jgi:PAS domain S-box-containing protein
MDRELLELVFDQIDNGIFIVDGQGVTIRVNRTFEEMSGFSNEELAGRNLKDMVGPGNYFTGSASLLVLERKRPVTVTYSTRTGRKLLVKGKPIFGDHGKIRYIINTVWDLTVIQYSREIDADTARSQILVTEDIITCSDRMREVIDLALRVAGTNSTLFLTGESGVGKNLLAKLIHRASDRKSKPLLQINCAAIPESLLESELFGYEAGAFTGADPKGKPGLFEKASGGTVFLDEITELPFHLQSKLLGVLQDKTFYRVGGRQPLTVDIRLIAATNRDLTKQVLTGKFREDLYYRLNVVPIHIPPLRDRPEDIPLLIDYFVDLYNRRHNSYRRFTDRLVKELSGLPWKGNIRELENLVERLIVTSRGEEIDSCTTDSLFDSPTASTPGGIKGMLQRYEDELLMQALREYRTTRRIAKALEMSQATVARKLKELRERAAG